MQVLIIGLLVCVSDQRHVKVVLDYETTRISVLTEWV